MNKIQNLLLQSTKYTDIILAVLIICIIALMILPLPPFLVDALIAANLSIAVTLLMLSLYIPSALSLSSFPTLLLFTTLFRLALNITTTRQILLYAYAGEIINTFGNLVVAGNFVVGGVIFLIITIVQFMVIAKGSERVAEVGARFTLDAMPGKQMSIDADLRAGAIDIDEARRRRNNVEKESQLYGAMDGAMKFVKGDAIAGLIVTGINILGGIAIGSMQKGMPVGEALQKYAILTIGDGLISQIPALFISITAGIIVTRVSNEDSPHLGGDIGTQVLAQPKALAIGGAILLSFALIPGFPKIQFIGLGLVIGGIGYTLYKRSQSGEALETAGGGMPAMAAAGDKRPPRQETEGEDFSLTIPLLIDVSANIRDYIQPEVLNNELVRVRKALYYDLGVPFPGIHLRFAEDMEPNRYTIMVQEIPMSEGQVIPGKLFVREAEDNLRIMGIEYEKGADFLPDLPTLWVDGSKRSLLQSAGIPFMDVPQVLTYHLSFILKKHADDFIGLQETKYLLDHMEERFGVLVKEVQRILPVAKITEVFQRLVQEEVSIRDLRTILQTLIEWGQKEKDVVLLTEYVRMGLRRFISYKYSGGQNILASYMFDPGLEEVVRKAIRQTSGGSYLALDPDTSRRIVQAVQREVGDFTQNPQKPVLLISMDIRRYVKKLIEMEVSELPVLSYQELTPEITIQPLGRVNM
ncbi:type III secretion system export apparatus subunit SctV [Sulfidibacter corallicola]|uniref:Type III secretion system export apparatus subunit SctV n=1 Tax=Sulfidibacter corallicola TaxID=2818388 RepID=A0A8A4TQA8_SULCO|nr:type III secretion system export apparatus subunit SctV [Sulfidibacter corallicola]QTD51111.1 type III secretion system export apparatus subunit SctV [Sulfidibacter corallicola]